MVLIADSGSTKTDWRLVRASGSVVQAKTAGFNPYFQDTATIYAELEQSLVPQIDVTAVQKVYFYGAGCSSENNKAIVRSALEQAFPGMQIEVSHDMMAAAHMVVTIATPKATTILAPQATILVVVVTTTVVSTAIGLTITTTTMCCAAAATVMPAMVSALAVRMAVVL